MQYIIDNVTHVKALLGGTALDWLESTILFYFIEHDMNIHYISEGFFLTCLIARTPGLSDL